jgi:tetratricopeptide (TPR) repeat protein
VARGAVKQRAKQPAPTPARRRQKQPKSWEEQLFFARLRNHAKWMFVFLALVFGVGFVAFGVGTGSNGLSDVLKDNFIFGGGGGGGSVSKAQKRVRDHPKDAAAYLALSRALQAGDKRDQAIAPMERYTRMRPKDTDALRELGSLYLVKGQTFQEQASAAQLEAEDAFAAPVFLPAPTTPLGKALNQDPIYTAVSTVVNAKVGDAYSKAQDAYTKAVATYKRLAAANPKDSSAQFELAQTAEQARDIPTAIAAYQRFIALAPQDPTTPAIRDHIKQLTAAQKQQSTAVPSG